MWEKHWFVASCTYPQLGTWPTTQAYAPAKNWTSNLSVCGTDSQPTELHLSRRMYTHIPFQLVFWVSLDKYPEEELLDPSLFIVIAFVLKSIFCGISIATQDFKILFLFSWNILFYISTFSLCVSFNLKWVFCRQYM